MTIASCQHCDQGIFWFARHSRWLHQATHSRYCAIHGGMTQAEPVGATVRDDIASEPVAV